MRISPVIDQELDHLQTRAKYGKVNRRRVHHRLMNRPTLDVNAGIEEHSNKLFRSAPDGHVKSVLPVLPFPDIGQLCFHFRAVNQRSEFILATEIVMTEEFGPPVVARHDAIKSTGLPYL